MIPKDASIKSQLLYEYHSTPIGGHAGFLRTYARLALQFYWPGMFQDVKAFVRHCTICQQAKSAHTHPAGLLQPLPIPQQIWEDISFDFITSLPASKGFTVIFVIVDRLSKFGHFVPLKSDFSSTSVAEAFIKNVVKLHGIPKTIVSDRDKIFLSQFWKHLFKAMGITLAMSSAYHPQSDAQTEALNKCLEGYLHCSISANPKQWVDWLSWAEFWYNSAFHTSAGMSPFKIVYGRDPPPLLPYYSNEGDPPELMQMLSSRDKILHQL